MPIAGFVIGASSGCPGPPGKAPRAGRRCAGRSRLSQATVALNARVDLADVGDARRPEASGRRSPPASRFEHLPERVVWGVEALATRRFCLPAWLVPTLVAAALLGTYGLLRVREEEVERVLGAVVERAGRPARATPRPRPAPAPNVVRAALALDVVGEDDVAVLGERRRQAPVERLRRLHRAGGDDDARPRRRAGSRRPNGARERRAVARREQDGVHEAVALLLPVVEADVARAPVVAGARADVGREVPRRVVGLRDLRRTGPRSRVLPAQLGLELAASR